MPHMAKSSCVSVAAEMLFEILLAVSSAALVASHPSVVIVGAGASGIAAATRLLRHGFDNVTVLEAEDRIGGRIYSVKLGDGYVDLGAEWCHGETNNIVYDTVKDLGILDGAFDFNIQFHHSKFKELTDRSFTNDLNEICLNLVNDTSNKTATLGEYLVKRFEEHIKRWKHDPEKYAIARQLKDLCEMYVVSNEGAFSWFDVAGDNDFVDSDGNHQLSWNGRGYKTILEIMMDKYPDASKSHPIDDRILLKKEVNQIHWDSDGATVRCVDGTMYSADHVVTTVSLGVLKHQYGDLFNPQLPTEKIRAIEQLGIAAVHKVLLHFGEKWWNSTYNGSALIWDEGDATNLSFKEGPIKNGKSWLTAVSVILAIPHNPNVLEVWIAGEFVPDIEKIPDKTFVDGFMFLLDYFQIANKESAKRPDIIRRNNWYGNPHFRGVYSFQTPRTRRGELSDEVILSRPLGSNDQKPVLLFAGEATNPTHYGTVHGAIETGHREADRLINMYK